MRKLIFVTLFYFLGSTLNAQLHISTNLREDFSWNSTKEDWVFISQDEEELTFFDFNKDMTIMKHTTPSITSSYMIKSSKKDEKKDQWQFDLVSDVGNKYLMIIDIKNNNLRFIGTQKDQVFMVRHKIKRVWNDE
jgi:hypothetical protein